MTSPSVAVIIRTFNEEKWLKRCLQSVNSQSYAGDLHAVVVDSGSTDRTIDIAKAYGATVVHCDHYRPGYSINLGIEATSATYIVLLSAHCIPSSDEWLDHLTQPLHEDTHTISAVYGRQLPTSSSHANDIRDLLITFGVEDKYQYEDTFFHNANSAFTRELWQRYPFDNDVTNIEDRIWAEQLIQHGHVIKYSARASVYHWHGIHQYGNQTRLENTENILRTRTKTFHSFNTYVVPPSEWTAFVLSRNSDDPDFTLRLVSKLSDTLATSSYSWKLVVYSCLSDKPNYPDLSIPSHFLSRDDDLSASSFDALNHVLRRFEDVTNTITDYYALFNLGYLWRDVSDIDSMISEILHHDCDLVVPEYAESPHVPATPFRLLEPVNQSPRQTFTNMTRSLSSSSCLLPGYTLIGHASLLHRTDTDSPCSSRIGVHTVSGQEKLLKVDTRSDYDTLTSRILL